MARPRKPDTSQGSDKGAARVIWPRELPDVPVRHPSRHKMPYRPRGQTRLRLELAGAGQVARPLTAQIHPFKTPAPAATARAKSKARGMRLAVVACLPLLGVGVILAGYGVMQDAPLDPPANTRTAPLQVIAEVQSPQISARPVAGVEVMKADINRQTALQPVAAVEPEATIAAPALAPQPTAFLRVPDLVARSGVISRPDIAGTTSKAPVTVLPAALGIPSPVDPFTCQDCTPALPRFENIAIEVLATDAEAVAVRDALTSLDAQSVRFTAAQIPVSDNQVRFYRPQDAAAAQALATRYGATLVDLTWFAPATDTAKIDLFLAASPQAGPPQTGTTATTADQTATQ